MRRLLLCSTIALSLSACGGNGAVDDAPSAAAANVITVPDTVRYSAEIHQSNLTIDADTEVSSIVAVFTEFPNLALTELLENTHASKPGCEAKRQTAEQIAAEQALLYAQYPLAVISDAGESLSVIAPSGTWPALEKIGTYGSAYSADWGAELGLLPSGSTLHVPGNEFPAVGDIELPHTEALTGVQFSNASMERLLVSEAATPSTVVNWDVPGTSSARMKLSLFNREYDDAGQIASISSLICDIDDSGSFAIPEEIKPLMDPQYEFRSLIRFNAVTEKRGDVLTYLRSESWSVETD